MTQVKIAELKDRLSYYLRSVQAGEEIEVTDRSRPIARIVPIGRPRVELIPPKKPFSEIRAKRYPSADWDMSSDELLREERRERFDPR